MAQSRLKSLVALLAGLLALIAGTVMSWDQLMSYSWSETTGSVTKVGTQTIHGKNKSFELPLLDYTFQVDGKSYTGQGLGEKDSTYKESDQITVFYNPSDPVHNNSRKLNLLDLVLDRGVFLVIFGVVMTTAAVFGLITGKP